jgi:hypothetical protein
LTDGHPDVVSVPGWTGSGAAVCAHANVENTNAPTSASNPGHLRIVRSLEGQARHHDGPRTKIADYQ